jgi:hypothetical protein
MASTIRFRSTDRMAKGWLASTTLIRLVRGSEASPLDHHHRLRTIKAYDYQDAANLLADFWKMVDAVLRERGVIR